MSEELRTYLFIFFMLIILQAGIIAGIIDGKIDEAKSEILEAIKKETKA